MKRAGFIVPISSAPREISRALSSLAMFFIFAMRLIPPALGMVYLLWAGRVIRERLQANLEKRLGEEAGGADCTRSCLSLKTAAPVVDDDPLKPCLKADIAAAKGRTILTETTASAWGEGMISRAES